LAFGRYIFLMFQKLCFLLCISFFSVLQAQDPESPYKNRKIAVTRDTIRIDSVAINPSFFKLTDKESVDIDPSRYTVNYQEGYLVFRDTSLFQMDSISIRYLKLPDFITREYSIYDQKRVLQSGSLYQLSPDPIKPFVPFEGLNTSGSITRGVTIGNNQNAVVNSTLDLQITGKISDKISLRASIQDTNIPLQDAGYSQKLDEFDQIFIELFSERWSVRAGDLFLENRRSRFLNFNKKVQGISTAFVLGSDEKKTSVFASAALVRGQYAKSQFTGQEGNQGPYKLKGPNGELYILIISGSERVYVNGIMLKRGENNDYVIDYNAGEIIFTTLFPITSEMRINVEYQYSDRNYTRFVTYAGTTHEQDNWSIGGFLYSENDVKNQPLQQTLSEDQVQALANAGDNETLMNAPSAYIDTPSENKILYRKEIQDGVEVYVYSADPSEVLYNVRFSFVGTGLGNYLLKSTIQNGRIFEYIAPAADGTPKGSYEPTTRLIPPVKLQVATAMARYTNGEKTDADFELAISNNDRNLLSAKDDGDNQGVAGTLKIKQRLHSGKWNIDGFGNYQYISKTFQPIERLFSIEFDRDWNLSMPGGDQSLLIAGTTFSQGNKSQITYQLEKLDFSGSFNGIRHVLNASVRNERTTLHAAASYLKSAGTLSSSEFGRIRTQGKYHLKKNWIGGSFAAEDNSEKLSATNSLTSLSQRYSEYGAFVGRGDSTKVFMELGFRYRTNDSLQDGLLQRVNRSHTYYLRSKLIQNEKTDLALYVNYRNLQFKDPDRRDEPSINSRLVYQDRFFGQLVQVNTSFETFSGSIFEQEFSYLEVEPGQGVYTWNDYNNNGTQELEEFEVALFPDQAKYVRIFLPNRLSRRTHQNKFSQSITLNPIQWKNENGYKKLLSYFYNQTSFLTDRKVHNDGRGFNFNPFGGNDDDVLGINMSFRNSLYYNRGKQDHSVTYTYLESKTKVLLSVGSQESTNASHQAQYNHLIFKSWLLGLEAKTIAADNISENYAAKNYLVRGGHLSPKISYLFSKSTSLDLFYEYQEKRNRIGEQEILEQQRIGTSFTYTGSKQFTMNGEFSLYDNRYTGNPLEPVAYQMLEGLQPGKNTTWRLLLQKNLTQYLDINLNYQGRKSETSDTIHTGSVQLRAYF
jgi:hypothetical protein